LGTTVTNQNLIQEEIERRFNSGNACYHSVKNLLSSRLLSKNVKIKMYKTIILPVVLYGCETPKLRVFENMVLRRVFGPKRDGMAGGRRELSNKEIRYLYSAKYNYNDQIEEDDRCGTCSTNERVEDRVYGIVGKARRREIATKTKT
jgi:hypothetical protein